MYINSTLLSLVIQSIFISPTHCSRNIVFRNMQFKKFYLNTVSTNTFLTSDENIFKTLRKNILKTVKLCDFVLFLNVIL